MRSLRPFASLCFWVSAAAGGMSRTHLRRRRTFPNRPRKRPRSLQTIRRKSLPKLHLRSLRKPLPVSPRKLRRQPLFRPWNRPPDPPKSRLKRLVRRLRLQRRRLPNRPRRRHPLQHQHRRRPPRQRQRRPRRLLRQFRMTAFTPPRTASDIPFPAKPRRREAHLRIRKTSSSPSRTALL